MSRKVLKLSERVEAIKLHDGGKSSQDGAQIMGSLYIIYIYTYTCTCRARIWYLNRI